MAGRLDSLSSGLTPPPVAAPPKAVAMPAAPALAPSPGPSPTPRPEPVRSPAPTTPVAKAAPHVAPVSRPVAPPIDHDSAGATYVAVRVAPRSATRTFMIEHSDPSSQQWSDLEPIQPQGASIGRDSLTRVRIAADYMARQHMRFVPAGDSVAVEVAETLNGVFKKITPGSPAELVSGSRFQVGHHVAELRLPSSRTSAEPSRSSSGEVFMSRAVAPLAYIDFLGPDGLPCMSYPITRSGVTFIGRQIQECDIWLDHDDWCSRRHAAISVQGGRFFLDDVGTSGKGSTNGTFVQIRGQQTLRVGDRNDPASADVLLVGEILLRVIQK